MSCDRPALRVTDRRHHGRIRREDLPGDLLGAERLLALVAPAATPDDQYVRVPLSVYVVDRPFPAGEIGIIRLRRRQSNIDV